VLSANGLEQLLKQPATSLCPICYTSLSKANFAHVASPTSASASASASAATFDPALLQTDKYRGSLSSHVIPLSSMSSSSSSSTIVKEAAQASKPFANAVTSTGTFYLLQGVVGAGKTPYAKELQRLAAQQNRYCVVEGMDKHVMQGLPFKDAAAHVTRALLEAQQSTEPNKIVVLDTCGENFKPKDVFGVDFSGWKIVKVWVNLDRRLLRQYLAWSLRNVVRRGKDDAVLTPGKATLATCIQVHLRKTKAHFGKKTEPLAPDSTALEPLLQQLQPYADEYDKHLAANKDQYAATLQ
jgi:hypothetical protein